ncbi:hypothetical protein MZ16F92_42050 [Escherichia coli]
MILSIDSNDANTAPLHKKTISSLSGAVESMMKKLEDVGVLVARILMPILFITAGWGKITGYAGTGFAPIFPDTCYHLTHYWPAAADIPVASDNPVHYAGAIRYNARTPLQGSLLPLTRLV